MERTPQQLVVWHNSRSFAESKEIARQIVDGLDSDAERMAVLSGLVLDELRKIIEKFPLQYQKEIVALLTEGYLERWSGKEALHNTESVF